MGICKIPGIIGGISDLYPPTVLTGFFYIYNWQRLKYKIKTFVQGMWIGWREEERIDYIYVLMKIKGYIVYWPLNSLYFIPVIR